MTNPTSPSSTVHGLRFRIRSIVGCAVGAALMISLLPISASAAPKPSVRIADVVVSESAGAASFAIKASPRPSTCCALAVDWATADGTATQSDDFAEASGTVTLTRSASTAIVTIPIIPDALDEPNETFTVNLSNLVGTPGKIADAQAIGTITDDDASPSISIDDVVVGEGDSGTTDANFTVSLSGPSGRTVTVDWATADGTAVHPSDFAANSGTATFDPGETSQTVVVAVKGDTDLELDEAFTVALTSPTNATVTDGSGTGTIVDDELEPVVSIDDATVTEGDAGTSTLSFTVSLSRVGVVGATVDWTTSNGSAAEPGDYASDSGTVTFTAGDVEESVDVSVNGDVLFEDDESIAVDLSNAAGSLLGDGHGVGTIVNDDAAPSVSISDTNVTESNTGTRTAVFDVTLSDASGVTASMAWATADDTALAGIDYVGASGIVSFSPGDVSETVSVTVNGDTVDEPDETFEVKLSPPNGAVIADGTAVGTILDNDKTPTALTLAVTKRQHQVIGKGQLEPAKAGWTVTVTLFRKRANGTFAKIGSKTVAVKHIQDRDGDGKNDGVYRAAFPRPKKSGTYRMTATFKGNANYTASSDKVLFSLS
jgi:hypothetical protein